ncbi:MAG: MBL fold metallo-hydrolase [Lachnospiraceae bacterium]|nr:MBL fold metallo-hydrolase [Lachnospiraceae bacterium]
MHLKERILNTSLTEDQIAIFYLGQVGFIIKFRGKYLLIDGYLSDYVDRHCSQTVKWKRNYPSPIRGGELDFIDYVFLTHEHKDHADPDTLMAISGINKKATYFMPKSIQKSVSGWISSGKIAGVSADKTVILDQGFSFMPIPSAHETLHVDENGEYREMGYIMKFDQISLYHSGDCCMYDKLEEKVKGTDILMLPINGRDYFRNKDDIIGCFDSNEAIILAQKAEAKLLIPTHFDLYSVNGVNPAYFVDCLYRINPVQRFHIFMPGEGFVYGNTL